ncbi:hypothetical protein Tco_0548702 [Tanacetum coccineum]
MAISLFISKIKNFFSASFHLLIQIDSAFSSKKLLALSLGSSLEVGSQKLRLTFQLVSSWSIYCRAALSSEFLSFGLAVPSFGLAITSFWLVEPFGMESGIGLEEEGLRNGLASNCGSNIPNILDCFRFSSHPKLFNKTLVAKQDFCEEHSELSCGVRMVYDLMKFSIPSVFFEGDMLCLGQVSRAALVG